MICTPFFCSLFFFYLPHWFSNVGNKQTSIGGGLMMVGLFKGVECNVVSDQKKKSFTDDVHRIATSRYYTIGYCHHVVITTMSYHIRTSSSSSSWWPFRFTEWRNRRRRMRGKERWWWLWRKKNKQNDSVWQSGMITHKHVRKSNVGEQVQVSFIVVVVVVVVVLPGGTQRRQWLKRPV